MNTVSRLREKSVKESGFTLLELLIVIVILAMLVGAMVPMFRTTTQNAKIARVNVDFEALRSAINKFKFDTGYYPRDNLTNYVALVLTGYLQYQDSSIPGWDGPYLNTYVRTGGYDPTLEIIEVCKDPWGEQYRYTTAVDISDIVMGVLVKGDVTCTQCIWLGSFGPDRTENTSDDIKLYIR